MLTHFLKLFVRTSLRNSGYTIINISGLAVGLACSILIMLWVWDETHFDQQHVLRDRIYQVKSFHKYPGQGNNTIDVTSGRLGPAMRDLPEVEQSCRLTFNDSRVLIQQGAISFYEQGVFVDSTVFDLFTIPIVEGVAFKDDNTMMLSQKLANKYFPEQSAVGKVLRINVDRDVVISGVFEDVPSNSTLKFDFMMPYNVYAKNDQYNTEWGAWTGGRTFVLLHEGTDIKALDLKIKKTFTEPFVWDRWGTNVELFLYPFTDSQLRNEFNDDGIQEGGRIVYVRVFTIVGIFILIVACINFMNLATARSVSRSKEIGVRKVSGAAKITLVRQFFAESVLMAFIALLISLVLVESLLPSFNTLTQKDLVLDFTNPVFVSLTLAITLLTGIIAGIYPAFLLSSLKPVLVLKGKFTGIGGKNIRKALVVFQFSLSTVLIVSALVANMQISFMRNKNLGFDRDNLFYFPATKNIDSRLDAFKQQAMKDPNIVSIAEADQNPMRVFGGMTLGKNAWPGKADNEDIVFVWLQCDPDFIPTMGMKIIEGRNFNAGDSLNFIINMEAARKMKMKDPVGTRLKAPHEGKVVGIISDFNTQKLQFGMQPIIIAMTPKNGPNVFVKYEKGKSQEALNSIQKLYKQYEQNIPIEYSFIDAPFGEMYENEILIEQLSFYFTIIAIFISCLGLFGLASFTAESRTKEIGIRKVLGASAIEIVRLLGKEFLVLMSIALAVGLPLGWYGVDNFLQKYAYHTEISAWLFIGITVSMIGITLISVGYQSAKAALMNPVRTLRSE